MTVKRTFEDRAKALRENLKKRKQQQRAREGVKETDPQEPLDQKLPPELPSQ